MVVVLAVYSGAVLNKQLLQWRHYDVDFKKKLREERHNKVTVFLFCFFP